MLRALFAATLLTSLILAVPQTSRAQSSRQGTYLYQNTPSWYTSPTPSRAYYPSANTENTRSYYPGGAAADKVLFDVTVPSSAKVSFQGVNTTQTGNSRRFVSPSMENGYRYSYNVQATWTENGKEVIRSQSIAVQPGDIIHVTFTRDGVQVRSE